MAHTRLLQYLLPAKAARDVIVDHPGRLHMRVANRRADEFEATLFQVLAHCVGFSSGRRVVFQSSQAMLDRFAFDEAPDVSIETAELFLNLEELAGIVNRRDNLCTVADYS